MTTNQQDFLLTPASQPTQSQSWGDYYRDPATAIDSYALTFEAQIRFSNEPAIKSKLAIVILEARLRGEKRTVVIYDKHPPSLDSAYHWEASIDELLGLYPASPAEMFDRALVNISRLAQRPGDRIQLDGIRERLLYGETREQNDWMLRQLEKLGYIHQDGNADMDSLSTFTIESRGWQQISELQRKPRSSSAEVFIAMSFQADMKPYFDNGILPAVEANGRTKCVRIDNVQHNNKICDEIIAAIRRSRYVVADFTGNRGGVYYEAGFAHGLGIPVIWTVRKSDVKKLHFDTRQYNHIVYETAEELQQLLKTRIAATIT